MYIPKMVFSFVFRVLEENSVHLRDSLGYCLCKKKKKKKRILKEIRKNLQYLEIWWT